MQLCYFFCFYYVVCVRLTLNTLFYVVSWRPLLMVTFLLYVYLLLYSYLIVYMSTVISTSTLILKVISLASKDTILYFYPSHFSPHSL